MFLGWHSPRRVWSISPIMVPVPNRAGCHTAVFLRDSSQDDLRLYQLALPEGQCLPQSPLHQTLYFTLSTYGLEFLRGSSCETPESPGSSEAIIAKGLRTKYRTATMLTRECHLPLHRGKLRLEREDMNATVTPKLGYAPFHVYGCG